MATRIPPLLEPYLALPPETSLILLTSVLGASTNWLVLRFLSSYLRPAAGFGSSEDDTKVLLISFLRDPVFWKDGARRLAIDLDKLAGKQKFAFLDGLTGLFLPQVPGPKGQSASSGVIKTTELSLLKKQIQDALQGLRGQDDTESKIILVIDQLDVLLATCGNKVTPVEVEDMLLDLREEVHSTILTLAADTPLVAEQRTPLEVNHSVFLLGVAHQADLTMSLRLLDTGTASDVSGVIRMTARESEENEWASKLEDRELLYFVGQDSGVRVFERGQ